MKTKKINKQLEAVNQISSCCDSVAESVETSSCCEQPTDGSSCCDKTESKEKNSEKTGCC